MDIIYNRFIAPFENKKIGNVGVELEYPLINLEREPVDEDFARGYLLKLVNEGLKVEDVDTYGNLAFVANNDGDVISFDNSYNNIEFSMNYSDNLLEIKDRFYKLYNHAKEYFEQKNYLIAGVGYNVYKDFVKQSHVSYPVYNMVDEYLHKYNTKDTHGIPDFPAYLSSVQTHLDADLSSMPEIADLFIKIDFLAAYIFSNSLCGEYLCYRDYLWENSGFGLLSDNTGSYNKTFNNIDGVIESFKNRSMFNRVRNGQYEIFEPVLLKDYFDGSNDSDIKQFLSFKNIEITARGTIEVRSTCTQPLCYAFVPSAFYLGIANNYENAKDVIESLSLSESMTELRHKAIKGELPFGVSEEEIKKVLFSLLEIAKFGLLKRGFGEEKLIESLYERVSNFTCFAKIMKKRLENGEKAETILRDFSKI